MTNEELLAAINARFDTINARFDTINARFDAIDARFNSIQEQLDDLEENAEITRDGVNTLLDWADMAGKIINYPIAN